MKGVEYDYSPVNLVKDGGEQVTIMNLTLGDKCMLVIRNETVVQWNPSIKTPRNPRKIWSYNRGVLIEDFESRQNANLGHSCIGLCRFG